MKPGSRVVLVTGAAGGLGKAIAVAMAREVAQLFRAAAARFGTERVLINNAALVPAHPQDEVRRRRHSEYVTMPVPRQSLQLTSSISDEDWHRYWGSTSTACPIAPVTR